MARTGFLILLLVVTSVTVKASIEIDLLDDIIELYEEKIGKRSYLDERFCSDTPYTCYRCKQCHDHLQFGLCIKNATSAQCLCKWGWTGANSMKVPEIKMSVWGHNRIRADDCKTPCHYTHDLWNNNCLLALITAKIPTNQCTAEICMQSYGNCIDGRCVPTCDELDCKSKFGKCSNGECVPTCDELDCKSKFGKCSKGKCVPTCDELDCKSKFGKCSKGECVPTCDEPNCKSKFGKCSKEECVLTCDELDCKSKFGKCSNGECVPTCDELDCKSKFGKCSKGKCVPTCDELDCKSKFGKCFNGECRIRNFITR